MMDQGVKRTFGDALSILGEPNATMVAAVTANVFWWEQDGVPVRWLDEHAERTLG
jgi:hypothetical protein